MTRTLLYAVAGATGLATLLSTALTSSDHYLVSELSQLQVIAAQAQVTSDGSLTEMSVERLGDLLQSESSDLQGGNGQWQMTIEGQTVIVVADASNNRMRIIAPVV